MKVLLVEDHQLVSQFVEECMEQRWPEAEVINVRTGQEGLDKIRSEDPDAIILDIHLPDISGLELLKTLRTHSQVPVLMLSGHGERQFIQRAWAYGADAYLVKPFAMQDVIAFVEAVQSGAMHPKDNLRQSGPSPLVRTVVEREGR